MTFSAVVFEYQAVCS